MAVGGVHERELLRAIAGALPFAQMGAPASMDVVVRFDFSRNPGSSFDWGVINAFSPSLNLFRATLGLGSGPVRMGGYNPV